MREFLEVLLQVSLPRGASVLFRFCGLLDLLSDVVLELFPLGLGFSVFLGAMFLTSFLSRPTVSSIARLQHQAMIPSPAVVAGSASSLPMWGRPRQRKLCSRYQWSVGTGVVFSSQT